MLKKIRLTEEQMNAIEASNQKKSSQTDLQIMQETLYSDAVLVNRCKILWKGLRILI
jgi:hypothetical protein